MSDNMEPVKPPFHLPPTTPTRELRKQDMQEWAIEDFTNCESDPIEEENRGEVSPLSTPLSPPLTTPHAAPLHTTPGVELLNSPTTHNHALECDLINVTISNKLVQECYLKDIPTIHLNQAADCDIVDLADRERMEMDCELERTDTEFRCEMDADIELGSSQFRLADGVDVVDNSNGEKLQLDVELELPIATQRGSLECDVTNPPASFSIPKTSNTDIQNQQYFSIPSTTASLLPTNDNFSLANVSLCDSKRHFSVYNDVKTYRDTNSFRLPPPHKEGRQLRYSRNFSIPNSLSIVRFKASKFSIPTTGSMDRTRTSFSVPEKPEVGSGKHVFSIPPSPSFGKGEVVFSAPEEGDLTAEKNKFYNVPTSFQYDRRPVSRFNILSDFNKVDNSVFKI
eukprot:sb/3465421/